MILCWGYKFVIDDVIKVGLVILGGFFFLGGWEIVVYIIVFICY